MANSRKRISELPPLNVASLDTTFVLGISGSTTYKISINNLTSSLDGAFATDLVTNTLSSSLNSKLSTSSFNQYTASAINGTISGSSQLTSSFDQRYVVSGSITQTTWNNIASKPDGIISSSTQISDLGFVTGSYTTINSFNSLTQSFNSISQSFSVISGSVGTIDFSGINAVTASYLSFTQSYTNDSSSFNNRITTEKDRIDAILSASNANGDTFAEVVSLINSVDLTNDNAFATFYTASNNRITALENSTGSYLTTLNGAISSSSQLTSSYDTRYTLSGSVQPLPSNLLSSSAQITAFGFISSSAVIPAGTISGSAQITTLGFISSSQTINTSSLATTGSNTFIGTETISGSLLLSGSFSYNGTPLQNGFAFAQPTLSKIVSNASYTGAASWTGTYVSSGGAIIVRADVTGYRASVGTGTAVLYRDGVAVASHSFFFNQVNIHTTLPTITYVRNSETGSHTYSIGFTDIVADVNDYLNITVLEYGNSAMFPTTIISGSSQLTSSFDTRYTLSGSISSTPSGTISGSSQLTSSFDGRYLVTGSVTSSISQLNTFTASISTASLVTSITNLNSFTQSFSTSVDSRLDTLETSIISGSPNYTQVLGNRRTGITSTGVSIISGSITTTGNPVQIMVTGDANPVNVTSWTRLQIYRDENAIGGIVQVENSSNLNVPYCVNVIDTPPAGTYSYSMRTVSGISGLFDFGESTGPVLTAVELKTNTNLPSTNNTFTGTNRFNGGLTIGGASGDEGGEIQLAYAQTNNTLTGSNVSVDVFQSKVRIFEGGGDSRGVNIDLSKAPNNANGELMWKASGMIAVGTFVTLDNLKCTVTSADQGNRGLSIGAVSTTFEADVSGYHTRPGSVGGSTGNNQTYTTTTSTSLFNWNFPTHGDMVQVNLRDKTNNRFYRITMMIGAGYISNFISIERLF